MENPVNKNYHLLSMCNEYSTYAYAFAIGYWIIINLLIVQLRFNNNSELSIYLSISSNFAYHNKEMSYFLLLKSI